MDIAPDDLAALLALLPRPMAWKDFLAEVLPAFQTPLVSANYAARVKTLVGQIESIDLADAGAPPRYLATTADLSVKLVGRLIEARSGTGESPYTLRGRLAILQRLCRLAVRRRVLALDPFDLRPMKSVVRVGRPRVKRTLNREEIGRLFEVLRGDVASRRGWALFAARRLLAMVATALGTGIRRNELLTLQVDDLDLDRRILRLVPRAAAGKGLKTEASGQPVGMPEALVPIIREWLEHRLDAPEGFPIDRACPWLFPKLDRSGPWLNGRTPTNPLGRLKAAGARAGLDNLTWHCLRRSMATLMEHFGAGRSSIQRQLRHTDVETTSNHYLASDEANIAAAVKDIRF
jgi:integrase/recombinase XerC